MTDRLIADIGGTNVRLAIAASDGSYRSEERFKVAEFASFEEAAQNYLDYKGTKLTAVACAVAGPVSDGVVRLTNAHWTLDEKIISKALKAPVRLLNDFEAIACGVPHLASSHFDKLTEEAPDPTQHLPMAVLGPGTGFGVGGAIPVGQKEWQALPGEGGHIGLNPTSFDIPEAVFGAGTVEVEAEEIVSGPGLLALYKGLGGTALSPEDVVEKAGAGEAVALTALKAFTEALGAAARDVALVIGAKGGVCIAGGIVPTLGALFDREAFLNAFQSSRKMNAYLSDIPVAIITHPNPALLGLAKLPIAASA